jgi:hypothetical protein
MSKNVNGVAGDYLSYLFVNFTLICNRSKNYKLNFKSILTSPRHHAVKRLILLMLR